MTADLTEEDEQLPHSASAATQLILSLPRFKGTLSCFKDLFKALILIGRGLFCHIKKVGGGRQEVLGGDNASELAEILKGGRLAEDLRCREDRNLKYRTQNACCNRYEIGLKSMKG